MNAKPLVTLIAATVFSVSSYAHDCSGGPSGGIGYDIKARPDNPDVMYVTDANAGVHKSTDGGLTWVSINQGIDARAGASHPSGSWERYVSDNVEKLDRRFALALPTAAASFADKEVAANAVVQGLEGYLARRSAPDARAHKNLGVADVAFCGAISSAS